MIVFAYNTATLIFFQSQVTETGLNKKEKSYFKHFILLMTSLSFCFDDFFIFYGSLLLISNTDLFPFFLSSFYWVITHGHYLYRAWGIFTN